MAELKVAPENAEATEAWNGPLFDVWQDFQAVVVSNAKTHGDAALADHHPERGDRVLDIGCGLGDSTLQLAALAGPEGHVHGVDVAERMIEGARADAERAGAGNVPANVWCGRRSSAFRCWRWFSPAGSRGVARFAGTTSSYWP